MSIVTIYASHVSGVLPRLRDYHMIVTCFKKLTTYVEAGLSAVVSHADSDCEVATRDCLRRSREFEQSPATSFLNLNEKLQ